MLSNRLVALLASVSILCLSGCGSSDTPSPTSPTPSPAPAPAPAPVLSLAGTWSGSFSVPGELNSIPIVSWTAAQTGSNVSGTMVLDQGEGQLLNATFTGVVAGSQLTSATFSLPAGSITGLPMCSISGTGTLAATASSVSGPLAIVVAPNAEPCVMEDGISATPTTTWTLSLTK